ncbi:MAG: thermonuclease family protein [Caldilineaceae bacterium]|nr:thermonuclease family protein [Caldilineaceae bacterium]
MLRTILWIMPLLLLLSACAEGGLVLPSPLQTPLAAPDAAAGDVYATEADLSSYLYTGPGRAYEEVGSVFPGKALRLTGQDVTGDWYRLDDGSWINALAVRGRPDLPVVSEVTGRIVAQVTEVLDGDTLVVNFNDRAYEVRLLLSVAPQVEQAFGPDAYEWTRDRLTGQSVLLESDVTESDAYGRLLRYVYVGEDEIMINEEILRAGLAQVAVFPPADRYADQLRRAQSEAEIARRGLWSAEAVPYREDLSGCTYTVQPGETLQVIARRFGILVESLAQANNVENPNLVPGGAELVLPGCGEAVGNE